MDTSPAAFSGDRSVRVPPGMVMRTAYVDIWKVRMACRERMTAGDVDIALRKVLQLGEASLWPCPNGHWDGDEFVIQDGRHEFVASVMAGRDTLLVGWLEVAA